MMTCPGGEPQLWRFLASNLICWGYYMSCTAQHLTWDNF